jgi:fido (protein-threonine AMPylation protein)
MREMTKELQMRWIAAQPLTAEDDRRLWDKYRLEWNYNSNHIEGNTLTYGETELLLFQGQTTGTHAIREYEEMKAHDVAITHIRELAQSSEGITEADVRNLNKIILKEPFWKLATTESGEPTRKQIIPGVYKDSPNNVRTATNELFQFASPLETPTKMRQLIEWLGEELTTTSLGPISLAAQLHHRFVLIHPFDDGNGRVARLLSNYVLMRSELPPIIVKSADKANYLAALRLADVGQIDPLITYFEDQLEWSLGIALSAAAGNSVEELSDIEKEIALFVRGQDVNRPSVLRRSPEAVMKFYKSGLENLISKFEARMVQLAPLFAEKHLELSPRFSPDHIAWQVALPEAFNDPRGAGAEAYNIIFRLRGYKGKAPRPFDIAVALVVNLQDFQCLIQSQGVVDLRKLYSEPILSDEADAFTTEMLKQAFSQVKQQSGSA